jgi:penicillin amidase
MRLFKAKRRSFSQWILRAAVLIAILFIVVVAAAYFWLRTGLTREAGTLALPGLEHPVTVYRDADAIPHIFAASAGDAYQALGFIHAQDRLFQMDLQRRFGRGQLSEILGSAALDGDRMMRTLDIAGLADRSFQALSSEAQAALIAYASGVNGFLAQQSAAWPPEYYAIMARPKPWMPADSLIWARLMALQLGGNWRSEIRHAKLKAKLSPAEYQALFKQPVNDLISLTKFAELTPEFDRMLSRTYAALPAALEPRVASNAWAIAPAKTATGHAILANDPHLGFSAPGLWYLAQIDAPDLHVAGATVAGVPFVILGQDDDIAWGLTTTGADTDDLFVERISEADPTCYDTPTGPRKFDLRDEIIHVRGKPDEHLVVRSTRHGPVVSDVAGPAQDFAEKGYVLALQATALAEHDRSADTLYRVNRAANWDDFLNALRSFGAPVQNFTYADRAGHIGLIAAGLIPIRASGDGSLPQQGWDKTDDWLGFIPFERLPQHLDPDEGRVLNANNRLVGADYPYVITSEWGADYRARRIADMIDNGGPATLDSSAAAQADTQSLGSADLLPRLLAVGDGSADAVEAKKLLATWDGRMTRDRAEPLMFAAWVRALTEDLFAEKLKSALDSTAGDSWMPGIARLAQIVASDSVWCPAATCPAKMEAAFERALDGLRQRYGRDMGGWRWGDAHLALLDHPLLHRVPVLRSLGDLDVATGGGNDTVKAAVYWGQSENGRFDDIHGASYRALYDLGDPRHSRFVISTGESGNPLSRHYGDFVERWNTGLSRPIIDSAEGLAASGTATLVLTPP